MGEQGSSPDAQGLAVHEAIHVPLPPTEAFRLFTEGIGEWWPLDEGYSYGGDRAEEIHLEPRVGGRFFERFVDGDELQVGRSPSATPLTGSCSRGGTRTGPVRPRSTSPSTRTRKARACRSPIGGSTGLGRMARPSRRVMAAGGLESWSGSPSEQATDRSADIEPRAQSNCRSFHVGCGGRSVQDRLSWRHRSSGTA